MAIWAFFIVAGVIGLGGVVLLIADERYCAEWAFFVGFLALVISLMVASGGLAYLVDSKECEAHATDFGVDYRYGIIAGCRYELRDGVFVPEDNWRVTEER